MKKACSQIITMSTLILLLTYLIIVMQQYMLFPVADHDDMFEPVADEVDGAPPVNESIHNATVSLAYKGHP